LRIGRNPLIEQRGNRALSNVPGRQPGNPSCEMIDVRVSPSLQHGFDCSFASRHLAADLSAGHRLCRIAFRPTRKDRLSQSAFGLAGRQLVDLGQQCWQIGGFL
jgi:hypothetical protein